jgi:uncharacterized membrane protein
MIKKYGYFGLVAMFVITGYSHLMKPDVFVKIIPPFLPFPYAIAILSGVTELILALGLALPQTRRWAAWATIVFLIAIFPANIYMFVVRETAFPEIPAWALLVRLPLQLVLIAWAYLYTGSSLVSDSRSSGKSRS